MIEHDDATDISRYLGRTLKACEMAQAHGCQNTDADRPRTGLQQGAQRGTERGPQHGAGQTLLSASARARDR